MKYICSTIGAMAIMGLLFVIRSNIDKSSVDSGLVTIATIEEWAYLDVNGERVIFMPDDMFRELSQFYEVKFDKVVFKADATKAFQAMLIREQKNGTMDRGAISELPERKTDEDIRALVEEAGAKAKEKESKGDGSDNVREDVENDGSP